jgi:hypothetical protein
MRPGNEDIDFWTELFWSLVTDRLSNYSISLNNLYVRAVLIKALENVLWELKKFPIED